MFKHIWSFFCNKKNQLTLQWLLGGLAAIAVGIWAAWQHITSDATLKSANKPPVTSVAPNTPSTQRSISTTTAIHYVAPSAKTGDRGISIVTTDDAAVNTKLTVKRRKQTYTHKSSSTLLVTTTTSGPNTVSGEDGISVTATGKSKVELNKETK